MSHACPSPEELRGLVDGSLSADEADAFERHLEHCEACQSSLQELVADGEFWQSAAASLSDQAIEQDGAEQGGDALDRVVDELRQQSPEDAEQMGEAIELKLSFIDPPIEPGTIGRLQHYDILRVAGRGGMGVVVKAFDRSLRRVVAIKMLAPHLAGNGQARQRFVREGRAAAGICHEHVITIHAVEENPPFLVMEFVQGETLEARINRNGALDVRETVRIAKQIAQGLTAAHAQGVVHRDIKPANILLENGVARVRITDFGLARAVDDASLTQSGVVAGTPQYMAPEQASGDAVDERADLFSLGSVIYTMLAGHAPFRATTAMGVLKRLCDHQARPIREINPEVPHWLVLLINRLHAKRPAERFQTADEVADLLERGLASLQNGNAETITIPTFNQVAGVATAGTATAAATVADPTTVPGAAGPGLTARSASGRQTVETSAGPPMPRWLLLPVPVWLIVLPLIVVATGPLGRNAAELSALTLMWIFLVALVVFVWRWLRREMEQIDENRSAADPTSALVIRFARRAADLTPRRWYRVVGWLVAWTLPAAIWSRSFFDNEFNVLYGKRLAMPDADMHLHLTALGVFGLWTLVAVVWFRRRRSDGSALFPHGRDRRILVTMLLAALFCACGLWTWHTDVHYLASIYRNQQLITERNRNELRDINPANSSPVAVQVNFAEPQDGTCVVIELPEDTPVWIDASQSGVALTGIVHSPGTYSWRAFVGQTEFAAGEVTLGPDRVAEITVPAPQLRSLIAGRWQSEEWLANQDSTGTGGGYPGGGYPGMGAGGMPGMNFGIAPGTANAVPVVELEFDAHRLLLVTHETGVANGQPQRLDRSDYSIEIDDSVEPALINLLGNDGRRSAGIVRFVPGRAPQSSSMDPGSNFEGAFSSEGYGAASMEMMGGGAGAYEASSPDVLEICVNDGSGLRPWEFKTNGQTGQTLLRLQRNHAKESLREEMAFQPVPTSAKPDHVTEAVSAWSRKLKIEPKGTNSLGMELVLVPPAEFKQIMPPLPGVTLPQAKDNTADDNKPGPADLEMYAAASSVDGVGFNVRPAQVAVTYPFVMTRRPVSIEHFRKFVEATGYVTDAERGAALPKRPSGQPYGSGGYPGLQDSSPDKTAQAGLPGQPAGPGGWQGASDEFTFLEGVHWQSKMGVGGLADVADSNLPVTQVSWRDASEFCQWLSETENRQYRLPTGYEWAAAMQLGVPQLPSVADEAREPVFWRNFDARAEHILKLQTHAHLFAEWTQSPTDVEFRLLTGKTLSPDGTRFAWSPQYSAGQTFRADTIGFRVVAELQTLAPDESNDAE